MRFPLILLAALIANFALPVCADDGDGRYVPLNGPHIFRLPPVEEPPREQPKNEASADAEPVEKPPAEAEKKPAADPKSDKKKSGDGGDKKPAAPEPVYIGPILVPEPFQDFWRPWDASIEFGLTGTEGNTETFNMRVGAKIDRKTLRHVHATEITHIDNSREGRKTALSTLIDGRYERLFENTKWSFFIHSLTEFDEFKAFDLRVSTDSGLGYEWIQTDAMSLKTRLGGSVSREFGGPNDEYTPELSSGAEWKHQMGDRHKISAKVDYFPDVTNFQEFRLNSRASWEVVVSPRWGLSMKLSAIDRYDSTPEGARPNDLNYSLLFLWSL